MHIYGTSDHEIRSETLPGRVIVRVSDSCSHGAVTSLQPDDAFMQQPLVTANDRLPVVIQLTRSRANAVATLTVRTGSRVRTITIALS